MSSPASMRDRQRYTLISVLATCPAARECGGIVERPENLPLTVNVTASDPDVDPINSLTADFSALPLGHDATFPARARQHRGRLSGPDVMMLRPNRHVSGHNASSGSHRRDHGDHVVAPPVVARPGTDCYRNGALTCLTGRGPRGVRHDWWRLSRCSVPHNATSRQFDAQAESVLTPPSRTPGPLYNACSRPHASSGKATTGIPSRAWTPTVRDRSPRGFDSEDEPYVEVTATDPAYAIHTYC